MDVLPDIQLQVDKVLEVSNPALFCTKLGSPITFHLQVGEGEEHLIKSVKRTVNSFGGRYVKRYHQMTPYTALLVTDLGFKSREFNRPAVCVTYIGDCVHTNSLRNLNEYLHPWEDTYRWSKVDLFDVVYSLSKMFDCSLRNVLSQPFVPVSRASKNKTFVKQIDKPSKRRNDSESSELIIVSSEDEDLFINTESEAEKSHRSSIATTNMRSSSPAHVQRAVLLEEKSPNSEYSPITEDVLLGTLPVTTEKCQADDNTSSSKQSVSRPKIQPTSSRKVHQESPKVIRETMDRNHDMTNRNPIVLIHRLSENDIRNAISNFAEISRQIDPKVSAGCSKMSTRQSKCRKEAKRAPASNKGTVKDAVTEKPPEKSDPVSVENNKNSGAKGVAESLEPHVSPLAGANSHSDGSKSKSIASKPKNMKVQTKQNRTEHDAVESTRKRVQHQGSTHGPSRRDDTKRFSGNSAPSAAQKRSRKHIRAEPSKSIMVSCNSVPSCSGLQQGTARTFAEKPSENSHFSTVQKAKTFAGKPSGTLHPPTVQKKTCEDDQAESCLPIIVSSQSVLPCSALQPARTKTVTGELAEPSGPSALVKRNCTDPGPSCSRPGHSKDSASTAVKSGKRYLQLQISINNSRRVKQKQCKRESTEDELLSDGGLSSASDVQCVPREFPKLDITDESYTSHQNLANDRVSQHQSPSLGLMTPKEEKEEFEVIKKRGRGYQDRYRRNEKVALLKWLVDHKKFKNLRGVIVWREMERKKVLPGRSHESMKNHFLKHLVKDLDAYPFLTEEQKNKLKGQNGDSSDEDGFFYHASSHHFAK
uniref:Telomeric repeat-binding factor 2-interacting protein 1 n=1 Tax=Lygus hesperus TaxID=30085 RepID=A0A146LWA0_LYGHE